MMTEQAKLARIIRSRDREIRDIHDNMSSWKEETANKMADKFTEELYNQLQV